MPRTNRHESGHRVPKGKLVLLVAIMAVGAAIWEFLSDRLSGLGWGLGDGTGVESGNGEKPQPQPKPPDPVDPTPPPKECEYRVQHDTIYHGKTALKLDEFLERARKCAESGKVVEIYFVRPYTEGFFFDLERELERAVVAWRPHYEK